MCKESAVDSKATTGAPTEIEIEITHEMMSAGADAIIWYDIENDDPFRIITAVLVAMGAVVDDSEVVRLRKRMA
jgi:hypothetical protein